MKIIYYNYEYEAGKHKIRKVWAEFMGINEPDIPSDCSVIDLDEIYNRKLAQALATNSQPIHDLPDKLYVNNMKELLNNETDEVVSINPNPQKEAYKLSQLYGLTHEQLDTYIDNNVTDLPSAKEFLKKLAHAVLWLVKQTRLEQ